MIVTRIHKAQGNGNQLACYVTTRCIALELGYDFGIESPENFKGKSLFKNIDFGLPVVGGITPIEGEPPTKLPEGILHYYKEKQIWHPNGSDISGYDWNLFKVKDNTKIDGTMQGIEYFQKYNKQIREWLSVEPLDIPDNVCIINFRGGEYKFVPNFFLHPQYWQNAINNMRKIRNDMIFEVVTDDPEAARQFFPDFKISHEFTNDYRTIQNASYLILSNSSFAIFPAWLNKKVKEVIYPRYFGRHNISDGYWHIEQNFFPEWWNQDRNGKLTKER
jgi:hypothetical protein